MSVWMRRVAINRSDHGWGSGWGVGVLVVCGWGGYWLGGGGGGVGVVSGLSPEQTWSTECRIQCLVWSEETYARYLTRRTRAV